MESVGAVPCSSVLQIAFVTSCECCRQPLCCCYSSNYYHVSRFGHGCFVLGLVIGSDLHSDFNLRLLPTITCQLIADSLL